ncbi:MAG: hypothetical protein WBN70_14420 [Polyangiales bacterium]|jgi:hypothetical protein
MIVVLTTSSVLSACGESGTTAEPRLRNLVYCENPNVSAPSCTLSGYSLMDDSELGAKLQTCAAGGCHGDFAVTTWSLDLSGSVEEAFAPLTTVIGASGDDLIDSFDPDCSYMLTKVTDQPAGGSQMPLSPPYWSSAEVDCFRAYLNELHPPPPPMTE